MVHGRIAIPVDGPAPDPVARPVPLVVRQSPHRRFPGVLVSGFVTGILIAGSAVGLLLTGKLPGLALRRAVPDTAQIAQVSPVAEVPKAPKVEEPTAPTTPAPTTPAPTAPAAPVVSTSTPVAAALAHVTRATRTATPEVLVRSANDLFGNPGTAWTADGATLLVGRPSGRRDAVAQQMGVTPRSLFSIQRETNRVTALSRSGATGWDGSWGGVRFSADGAIVLFYELFSRSRTDDARQVTVTSSSADGFYAVSLRNPSTRARKDVPSDSRILLAPEDKAFPAPAGAGDKTLLVTTTGEYLLKEGTTPRSLGAAVDIDGGTPRLRYSLPTWSPDGHSLAFVRHLATAQRDGDRLVNAEVYALSLTDNATLADLRFLGRTRLGTHPLVFEDVDIDWAPDSRSFWAGEAHDLFTVDRDRTVPAATTLRPYEWSPTGDAVLALRDPDSASPLVAVVSLTDGSVTDLAADLRQVTWRSNDELLARSADRLLVLSRTGTVTQTLVTAPLTDFSLAPDRRHVAWIVAGDVWTTTLP